MVAKSYRIKALSLLLAVIFLVIPSVLITAPHSSPSGVAKAQPDNAQVEGYPYINVTEVGLPAGWTWFFNIETYGNRTGFGAIATMSQTSLTLMDFQPGTYMLYSGTYENPDVYISTYLGNVTLGTKSITLRFYPVNISETGNPANLKWGVTDSSTGSIYYANNSTYLHAYLPNGPGTIHFGSSGNYYAAPESFTVDGSGLNIVAHYHREYIVTFIGSGLSKFSQANYFNVYGLPVNIALDWNPPRISYMLTNGTYNFTVYPTGTFYRNLDGKIYNVTYHAYFHNNTINASNPGTFKVDGSNETVTIQFNATYTIFSTNPNYLYIFENLYFLATIGLLAALVITIVEVIRRKKGGSR